MKLFPLLLCLCLTMPCLAGELLQHPKGITLTGSYPQKIDKLSRMYDEQAVQLQVVSHWSRTMESMVANYNHYCMGKMKARDCKEQWAGIMNALHEP